MSGFGKSSDPRQFRAVVCNNCYEITVWSDIEKCHLCSENIGSKSCTTCHSFNIVYLPHHLLQYIACLDCGVRDESGLELIGLEMQDGEFRNNNLKDSIWNGCWVNNGDFSFANLSRSIIDSWFKDCNFAGATLLELKQENDVGPLFMNCNFTGATLHGSDLSKCDFTGSTFNRTDLSNVCFDYANLSNIDLRDALLDGATFEGTILEGTIFPTSHIDSIVHVNDRQPDKAEKETRSAMREDYMRDEPL